MHLHLRRLFCALVSCVHAGFLHAFILKLIKHLSLLSTFLPSLLGFRTIMLLFSQFRLGLYNTSMRDGPESPAGQSDIWSEDSDGPRDPSVLLTARPTEH